MSREFKTVTLTNYDLICSKVKMGIPTEIAIAASGMCRKTFYQLRSSTDERKTQHDKAVGFAVATITSSLLADKSTAGRIFVASRGFSKFYGKYKEEEMRLEISDETRKVMTDDTSTGEKKIAALNKDFYANKIQLPLFEKLVGIVKLSHPEMSKTELSGEIKIYDALVPTR